MLLLWLYSVFPVPPAREKSPSPEHGIRELNTSARELNTSEYPNHLASFCPVLKTGSVPFRKEMKKPQHFLSFPAKL